MKAIIERAEKLVGREVGDADDAARQVEENMAVGDYQTLMLLVMQSARRETHSNRSVPQRISASRHRANILALVILPQPTEKADFARRNDPNCRQCPRV
jgi:hypothetical protein